LLSLSPSLSGTPFLTSTKLWGGSQLIPLSVVTPRN
jgi:hypothetical protein